jgi:hypothetical protein
MATNDLHIILIFTFKFGKFGSIFPELYRGGWRIVAKVSLPDRRMLLPAAARPDYHDRRVLLLRGKD